MNRPNISFRRLLPLALVAGIALLAALAGFLGAGPGAAAYQETAAATAAATVTITPTPTTPPSATPSPLPSATPTAPAPTLVPPTPLPTATTAPPQLASASGLADAQENGVLRVGTVFNAYPFAWLNEFGQVVGYEADIMNAIAIELGIEIEYVQVTRHNADHTLLSGTVDALIGQQIHTRDREDVLDFSHPYYVNYERMVVLTDAPYSTLAAMAGQPVSVEIGSRSERALRHWMAESGISFEVRTALTENEALDLLAAGEVQGMVGEMDSLRRAGRQGMRFVDQPLLEEPYGIVVRRWDANLRNLLNRSLQRLKASGRLDQIFAAWFPNLPVDFDTLVPVYEMLYEDERALADFNADVPFPDQSVLDRLAGGQPLRVAGAVVFEEDAPAQARLLDALNRALVEEMGRRWGVEIEYVPNSSRNAVDLVATGGADLAVGVSPRWDGADRVEYSLPYVRHSDRLLVPARSDLTGFADMLGTGWWIGYFADDAQDAELIRKYADLFGVGRNIREPFAIQNESRALYIMTVENNLDAIFGDNLRLLALMREGDADSVKMLDTPYGDILPITFAVPRNDADFRAQVDFALQDMAREGVFQQLWETHLGLGEPVAIPHWGRVSPDAP